MKRLLSILLILSILVPAAWAGEVGTVKSEVGNSTPTSDLRLPTSPTLALTGPTTLQTGAAGLFFTAGSTAKNLVWRVEPDDGTATVLELPLFRGLDADGKPIVEQDAAITFTTAGKYLVIVAGALGDLPAVAVQWVTVTGQTPEPDPDPDPEPDPDPTPAKWQVAIFFESADLDNLTLDQRELIAGLAFRKSLEADGHVFVGAFDVDAVVSTKTVCRDGRCQVIETVSPELAGWWQAIRGKTMPRLAIAPMDGSAVRDYPLPADAAALKALLKSENQP